MRTRSGVVTLSGTVSTLAQRRLAESIATDTSGVLGVSNLITVKPPEVSAEALADAVTDAFARNAVLHGRGITVQTKGGVITLQGKVANGYKETLADTLAGQVPGATEVHSALVITGATERGRDARIKRAIERQLRWSPHVSSRGIRVRVDNGVATLSGTVRSHQQWFAATHNARQGGADRVLNELVVSSQRPR